MSGSAAEEAVQLLRDAGYSWQLDHPEPGVHVVRFARTDNLEDCARLDIIRDEVFTLEVGPGYVIPEYNYDDGGRSDELAVQVRRGLNYLDGRCEETRRERDGLLIRGRLLFPDGATARLWLPPWKRRRARATGKSSPFRTSSHP